VIHWGSRLPFKSLHGRRRCNSVRLNLALIFSSFPEPRSMGRHVVIGCSYYSANVPP